MVEENSQAITSCMTGSIASDQVNMVITMNKIILSILIIYCESYQYAKDGKE